MTLEKENEILRRELKGARKTIEKLIKTNELLVFRVGAKIEAVQTKADSFKSHFE